CGLSSRVKRVAKRNLVDVLRIGILLDLGIDEEHYRHIHLLTGLERLLGETEALDLLEIFPRLVGRDIVGRLARPGPSTKVLRSIENLRLRSRPHLDRVLLGLEAPRQTGVGVGVEANADLARDWAWRLLGP